ncbi:unnamed protein product (macronuclear) [Paramecium tetraurelia]|uniref:FCP1 homology domain-containing protein n=1 Tax=Paramecium tetraurelia TaxID=5888 RepID=A0CHE5_PARTE|nr:uncharacterized protein GSPATT00038314001 [Paramecium tetraurelia]CAK70212.1 unnamed protein product [Paramecium tetraurelia]|eukprot:XP_001437609.1 hypothetical protein (macronuclear) [Paramecium tetraurelia strain d4-2]
MQFNINKTTPSRLDNTSLKAKLTKQYEQQPIPSAEVYKSTLSKLYQTQSLSTLIKDKKSSISRQVSQNNPFINPTVRTNTPKSTNTTPQYYFYAKSKEQSKVQISQLISKTLQQSYTKASNSLIKDNSFGISTKSNTDRKYNLLSLDQNKLISKPKTEKVQSIDRTSNNNNLISDQKQSLNIHLSLDDFVTQVKVPNSSKNNYTISPFKQAKSLSPNNRLLSTTRKNIYYVSSMIDAINGAYDSQCQLYRDHALQTYNSIGFCLNQIEPNSSVIEKKLINLPQKNTKFQKTVVFDLDETLIHCNENQNIKSDVYLPITFPSGDTVQAGINIRPWAKQILNLLSEVCEVVVFTASHQCYASQVIQFLDQKKILSAQLFRESCIVTNDGVHIKDLRVLGRDMKDIVLIDNAAYSFGYHIENGIPIIPYYDNKEDKELRQLYDFLMSDVLPAYDCRKVIQETFKLREFQNYNGPKVAIEKLYY